MNSRNHFWIFCILLTILITTVEARTRSVSVTLPRSRREYSTQHFGDLAVTHKPLYAGTTFHGYRAHSFSVENLSADTSHTLEIRLPKETYSSGSYIQSISRAVSIYPGAKITLTLYQPPLEMYGKQVEFFVDGKRHLSHPNVEFREHNGITGFRQKDAPLCILTASGMNLDDMEDSFKRSGFRIGSSSYNKHLYISRIQNAWAENWLAYSPFDAVAITAVEYRKLQDRQKSALLAYVRCGGTLCVSGGRIQVPEPWARSNSRSECPMGFGRILFISNSNPKDWSTSDTRRLSTFMRTTRDPWKNIKGPIRMNKLFPVVEKTGINIRAFLMLMFLFVIVVGPVNYFLLLRKKSKAWVLFTAPVISLATCVIIVGYAYAIEGIRKETRIGSFTILDQRNHEATTLGIEAFYCRITPGSGLSFSPRTEVTPMIQGENRYSRYSGYRRSGTYPHQVNWTENQHLSSGWIKPRIPAYFFTRKPEKRRERIRLITKNGTKKIVNGFGTNILKIYITDHSGTVYTAKNITAGSEAILDDVKLRTTPAFTFSHLRHAYNFFNEPEIFGFFSPETFFSILTSRSSRFPMVPGTYYALIKESVFLENGLGGSGDVKTNAAVFGILNREKTRREN